MATIAVAMMYVYWCTSMMIAVCQNVIHKKDFVFQVVNESQKGLQGYCNTGISVMGNVGYFVSNSSGQ